MAGTVSTDRNKRIVYYAGIGSRETPPDTLETMERIGTALAIRGFVLRSGGADGADRSFETGCDAVRGPKEIFLPWEGFNGRYVSVGTYVPRFTHRLIQIANTIENTDRYSQGVQKLKWRNVCQVLGRTPEESPQSSFVICYHNVTKLKGGTRFAMALARSYDIPVWNLYFETESEIMEKVDQCTSTTPS